jgi:hypothetical protein
VRFVVLIVRLLCCCRISQLYEPVRALVRLHNAQNGVCCGL